MHGRNRYQNEEGEKMTPVLAAIMELFSQGAALAVSIYLLWKQQERKDEE